MNVKELKRQLENYSDYDEVIFSDGESLEFVDSEYDFEKDSDGNRVKVKKIILFDRVALDEDRDYSK